MFSMMPGELGTAQEISEARTLLGNGIHESCASTLVNLMYVSLTGCEGMGRK